MQFNFTGNIKDVQNRLVAQSIREVSNLQLLRSEEAIRAVIKSYTDRFRSVEGKLTDASKYVAKSRDVIKTSQFNDLFESIYIDLAALYNDLELVDNVLNLNLYRNKNYLSVIKKRINDLWLRLNLTRLNIYDSNPASESFYESFNTSFNLEKYNNIVSDKKFGLLYLTPTTKKLHNDSISVESITATTYPAHNEDGGVTHTTNILNTFTENYTNGSRDMLQNGLWKEEVLTIDIPDMVVNIGDADDVRYKSYKGIVSIVDVVFSSPIPVNRFDFDLFGEMVTRIDQIMYKTNNDDVWNIATYEPEDELTAEVYGRYSSIARGSSFNALNLLNLVPFNAKIIRIIFLKDNYSFIDSTTLNNDSINQQIFEDFSERRYEVFRFGTSLDEHLSKPVVDENFSLYSKILSIIESTRDLDRTLQKINTLLNPKVDIALVDFNRLLKYEVGAWSIEPIEEKYTNRTGYFQSVKYKIEDKSLVSVSLNVSQSIPRSSTSNWYIGIDKQMIPIVENSTIWRKEPANFIDLSSVPVFASFPGQFILLDFPISSNLANLISVYYEGTLVENVLQYFSFFNSRLIYLDNLSFENANIVIRYPVDMYKCVNLYVLTADQPDIYTCGIVASRKNALQLLIDSSPALKGKYVINGVIASKDDANGWFNSYAKTIFVDSSLEPIATTRYDKVNLGIQNGISKLQTNYTDVSNFLSGLTSSFMYEVSNNDISLVPMNLKRKI